ncbi:MAG: SUMF1/EgtB/PvdO family nonheme iron enzyme [Candidatus Eremiobacteraeota bacterium]|nr:SUMF1/EgtB/PvdO family nonheme iron enzyme [Candidatus Eremiobacteraeota bacterium]MBV9408900.1 SUMF1/EgtB/PvdO family nonheme iron enzyme [Candidatus Eremiobacteraeota bacterium]
MDTLAPAQIDREALASRYRANRRRTAGLYAMIAPESYYEAPIPLRHPFVFYDGHIPAFSFYTLVRDALKLPSVDAEFERLFDRGIDPNPAKAGEPRRRFEWPERERVQRFGAACDNAVLAAYATAKLDDPSTPNLVRGEAAYTILEHEEMHDETLVYIIHRLAREKQRGRTFEHRDLAPPRLDPIAIPAGRATLGARRDALAFGWDNEFEQHTVEVGAFSVDAYSVTNGEYLAFVRDGGPVPAFWLERDGRFELLGCFEDLPLPLSWPVWCTQEQATAFARWSGGRLMTEAEYHRAAFAMPSGEERAHPWGDAAPDPNRHGNFGWRRFDPEPVGSSPQGASAWGVHDLVGNGWEWTATPFAPFDGFRPMASYLPYSTDFFDGKHFVMKGGSPVTTSALVRRSLRNWFYGDYPYMYAKFRRVYD